MDIAERPHYESLSEDAIATSELEARLRELTGRLGTLRRRVESAGSLVRSATVEAESAGGEVTVTVDLAGAVVGIRFGPAIRAMRESDLAATVVAVYGQAVAQASRLAADLAAAVDESGEPACPRGRAGAH
ncbi:YbaB/EbfC family nucleoid-associated protein [Glycomyces sp. NPDC047010]|uniref:YbaB/EbfC family nucleoid-associated protein n=1 Tax=Glycomyces sp. NPDC047010 TaxID=3155023 RepID=UPI0033C98F11